LLEIGPIHACQYIHVIWEQLQFWWIPSFLRRIAVCGEWLCSCPSIWEEPNVPRRKL
jgi:hypothetical protein